jgi:hypothetical protein
MDSVNFMLVSTSEDKDIINRFQAIKNRKVKATL